MKSYFARKIAKPIAYDLEIAHGVKRTERLTLSRALHINDERHPNLKMVRDVTLLIVASTLLAMHASTRAKSLLRSSNLRRVVSIICALTFLAVGFAHAVHHHAEPSQVSVSSSDNAPDASKKPGASVEHCHGCSMIAIAVPTAPIILNCVATDPPVVGLDNNRPFTPVAETPPPIVSI